MSATGELVRTARSSAFTLRSRPTCSGTIISGKITVSRSATIGSTWMLSMSRATSSFSFAAAVSPSRATSPSRISDSMSSHTPSVEARCRFGLLALDVSLDIICIEQVVDADLAERLELKDDLDARQVDPLALGQEADDTHPPDVRLRVEAEVVAPLRADEAFFLVDPQRTRVHARQLGGDADEVDRPVGRAA